MERSAIISAITSQAGKRPEVNVSIEEETWFASTAERSRYDRFMLLTGFVLSHLTASALLHTIPHKENVMFSINTSPPGIPASKRQRKDECNRWEVLDRSDRRTNRGHMVVGRRLTAQRQVRVPWTPCCLLVSKTKVANFIKAVLAVLFLSVWNFGVASSQITGKTKILMEKTVWGWERREQA